MALQRTLPRYFRRYIIASPILVSCHKVHPKLLTEALMEASEADVVVAKVVGGQTEGGRVRGVELEGGRILPCDVVVLCMGPWTGGINPECLLLAPLSERCSSGAVVQ